MRLGDGWERVYVRGQRKQIPVHYARVMAKDPPDYIVIRRDWLAGGVAWAGLGAPFVSQQQADSALAKYEPLRSRADRELTEGAAKLLILRRK